MAGSEIAVVGALADAFDAHWVTGAPARTIQCPGNGSIKLSRFAHPDEAAHRAFGIACGGVDQHPGHLRMGLGEVDPFTKRGRAVSAVEYELTDQHVREGVEQNETWGGVVGVNLTTLCLSLQIPIHLPQPLLVDRPKGPASLGEALIVEDEKDAFAAHDDGRQPVPLRP